MHCIHFHVIFKENLTFAKQDSSYATLEKGSCYALNFYDKSTKNLLEILDRCGTFIAIFKIEKATLHRSGGDNSFCISKKDFLKYLKHNKISCFRILTDGY